MGFRDFISSWRARREISQQFAAAQAWHPPTNPSRAFIDGIVRKLLRAATAREAHRQLEQLGAAAVPALTAVLEDPRFQRLECDGTPGLDDGPLDHVLRLLAAQGSRAVVRATAPLIESSNDEARKLAGDTLATLGLDESIPTLLRLLQDEDGFVRSYVQMGVWRALDADRCSAKFRRAMYEAFLDQCLQEWRGTLNDSAPLVIRLDRARAAIDFARPGWLTPENENAYRIVEVCNEARILLPMELLRSLIDHSLPRAVGENCHPHPRVVGTAIEALALRGDDAAQPLLERLLESDQGVIQISAAKGLATLSGIDDPIRFVFDLEERKGLDALSAPQRIVFLGQLFDQEVSNGGIMQFFGNSSGDRTVETLEALRTLGHPEAIRALEGAVRLVGPLAREPDRETRLTAFEDRFDELEKGFEPLQSAFFATSDRFAQRLLLYAIANKEHFRRRS